MCYKREVLEEYERFANSQIQDVIDGFPFVAYFQRLSVVTFSLTCLAQNLNVGKEVHLDESDSGAAACLASSAFYVEGESSGFVASDLRLRQFAIEFSDVVEYFCICRWI